MTALWPGSQRLPRHLGHVSTTLSVTSLLTPLAAWANVRFICNCNASPARRQTSPPNRNDRETKKKNLLSGAETETRFGEIVGAVETAGLTETGRLAEDLAEQLLGIDRRRKVPVLVGAAEAVVLLLAAAHLVRRRAPRVELLPLRIIRQHLNIVRVALLVLFFA